MVSPPSIATLSSAGTTHSWRWVVVLVASLLLHLIALEWANGHLALPSPHDEQVSVVTTVELHAPALPNPPPHHAVKPKLAFATAPKPRRRPAVRPAPAPIPTPVPTPVPEPDPAPTSALTSDTPSTPADPDTPAVDSKTAVAPNPNEPAATEPAANQSEAKADTSPEKQAPVRYKVDLPPSAELKYDVEDVPVDGTPSRGSGTITWQNSGGNYQVTGEAGWLFITMLNFKSEGVLDAYGVAPVLYSEKHFRRSETDTHFNRDARNSISFSASTISYPLKGGEQDHGSVMWQLAGIGRGDREKFVPGTQIDVFVAGVKDGDLWSILVVGLEEIEVAGAKTLAWHVVRIPRAGTYDKKYDIWLAPQYAWSPVKIRETDHQGEYLEMSMSAFHPSLLASTPAESAR